MVSVRFRSPNGGGSGSGSGFTFPLLGAGAGEELPVEPPGWRSTTRLLSPVEFSLPAKPKRAEFAPPELPPPFLARVLDRLEDAVKFDVIADSFYVTRNTPVNLSRQPLGEALTWICRNTIHRWTYQKGFVQTKDRQYSASRGAEPSIFKLREWVALTDEQFLSLDRLADLVNQPPLKLTTTIYVLGQARGIHDWGGLAAARGHLLFWRSLNSIQRKAALSERGLAYQSLNPPLRQAFERLVADRSGRDDMPAPDGGFSWTPAKLSAASLAITRAEQQMMGFRSETGWSTSSGATPEQTKANLLRNNPGITEKDLRSVSRTSYRFHYRAPDGPGNTIQLHLPPVWQKPAAASK